MQQQIMNVKEAKTTIQGVATFYQPRYASINPLRVMGHCQRNQKLINNTGQQKNVTVNLTMEFYTLIIMQFPDFLQHVSFEILSVKKTKKAILTYFRVPLDIKQQYLKSKYFIDVIENSFLFDFQITT